MRRHNIDEECEDTGLAVWDCECEKCCLHDDGSENGICITCGAELDFTNGASSFPVDGD